MSELFRFAVQRPIQRATPKEIAERVIKAYEEPQRSTLHQQLRDEHQQGDGQAMVSLAKGFIAGTWVDPDSKFVEELNDLKIPLAALDVWLLDRGDEVPPKQVSAKVKDLADMMPGELVDTGDYRTDRRSVADSLLALVVAASGGDQVRAELMRAMYLFGLLERLAKPPAERPETAAEVWRLLARGIVALPPDVFPLPAGPPREQTLPVDEIQPEELVDPRPEEVTLPETVSRPEDLVRPEEVRFNHLLGAIRELNRIYARPMPQTIEGDGSPGGSETRWGLPEGVRVSATTREAVEAVLGPAGFANLPETINSLEVEAAALGAAVMANGQASTMVSFGNGVFDLLSYRTTTPGGTAKPVPGDALVRAPAKHDLKVVRQKLKKYELGEVAHIENVLKGESKGRTHRRKTATETTVFTETERTEETGHDLQTTERFELQSEATKTVHDDFHLEADTQLSAEYPPVKVTANAGFALNHSKEESSRQASSYARDVTARSISRIEQRVKEQRTVRTLTEIEETNSHSVDNSDDPEGHVVGIYRWVDKVYEAQTFDYGGRLLLEFNVPEPAAFFLHALAHKAPEGITLDKPVEPMATVNPDTNLPLAEPRKLSPADVTPLTYLHWVTEYKVSQVTPPPKPIETVSTTIVEPNLVPESAEDHRKLSTFFKTVEGGGITLPSGYRAKKYYISFLVDNGQRENMLFSWTVGIISDHRAGSTATDGTQIHAPWIFHTGGDLKPPQEETEFKDLPYPEGMLPVALYLRDVWGYSMTLEVSCERTDEKLREWQLETYEQIMRAYFELKSQYDEQVAAAAARAGIGVAGSNPLKNRETEKAELKKATIAMLSGFSLEEFNAIFNAENDEAALQYPEIDPREAQKEGRWIQFFEQAFEWPLMSYLFYPYFWGRKDRWITTYQIDDPADPLFATFLRAGAARVVVPVREGFEDMVNWYLGTNEIWGGGQVPAVGKPLYISIAQEIRNQQDADPGGVPEGTPWPVTLPTTLVMLQEDAELP